MLSKWTIKLLGLNWKITYFLRATHYYPHYRSHDGQLYLKTSSNSTVVLVTKFLIMLYAFYPLFILYKIIYLHNQVPLSLTLKLGYMLSAFSFGLVAQLVRSSRWNEIPEFHNQVLKFFQVRHEKRQQNHVLPYSKNQHFKISLETKQQENKILHGNSLRLKKYVTIPVVLGLFVNLINIVLIFKKPHTPHFLTSVFCTDSNCVHDLKFPVALFHVWLWYYNWVGILIK